MPTYVIVLSIRIPSGQNRSGERNNTELSREPGALPCASRHFQTLPSIYWYLKHSESTVNNGNTWKRFEPEAVAFQTLPCL